jgi:hypothetical protein
MKKAERSQEHITITMLELSDLGLKRWLHFALRRGGGDSFSSSDWTRRDTGDTFQQLLDCLHILSLVLVLPKGQFQEDD